MSVVMGVKDYVFYLDLTFEMCFYCKLLAMVGQHLKVKPWLWSLGAMVQAGWHQPDWASFLEAWCSHAAQWLTIFDLSSPNGSHPSMAYHQSPANGPWYPWSTLTQGRVMYSGMNASYAAVCRVCWVIIKKASHVYDLQHVLQLWIYWKHVPTQDFCC